MSFIFLQPKPSRLIWLLLGIFIIIIGGLGSLSWRFLFPEQFQIISPVSQLREQSLQVATVTPTPSFSNLSSSQLAGQLLISTLIATELTASEAASLAAGEMGGVLLLGRNITGAEQLRKLTTQIRAEAAPSGFTPFIAVDQEGGRVSRIDWIETTGQAEINSVSQARQIASKRGQALKALGISVNLAPVVECFQNKDGFISAQKRGFKTDCVPKAAAMVSGYQEAGILPVAKHFPDGLAWVVSDPHLDLPVVTQDIDQFLASSQLYRQLIEFKIPALMVTHLSYPLLDSQPSSASRFFLTSLLAENFGFSGLVVIDDLSMKAVSDRYELSEFAVTSLQNGADVLIVSSPKDYQQVLAGLIAAQKNGLLKERELERKLTKVQRVKKWLSEH